MTLIDVTGYLFPFYTYTSENYSSAILTAVFLEIIYVVSLGLTSFMVVVLLNWDLLLGSITIPLANLSLVFTVLIYVYSCYAVPVYAYENYAEEYLEWYFSMTESTQRTLEVV